jgi:KDO2-lipid IV(A) lauroyltransferase
MNVETRNRLEYAGAALLTGVFGSVPASWARAWGMGLGELALRLGIRREVTLANLASAFPERGPAERAAIAREAYRTLGRTAAEFLRFPVFQPKRFAREFPVEGVRHLGDAHARGRGAILLTGHMGNWEYLAVSVVRAGFPLHVVAGRQRNPYVEEMINRYRALAGIEVSPVGQGLRGALRALRAGSFVSFLADQDAGPEGIFLPFLGRSASTPTGPFALARKYDVPVVTGFAWWDGRRHGARVDEPIEPNPTDDPAADVRRLAALYTERLEAEIRRHPGSWLWLHRRWKTRPAAER